MSFWCFFKPLKTHFKSHRNVASIMYSYSDALFVCFLEILRLFHVVDNFQDCFIIRVAFKAKSIVCMCFQNCNFQRTILTVFYNREEKCVILKMVVTKLLTEKHWLLSTTSVNSPHSIIMRPKCNPLQGQGEMCFWQQRKQWKKKRFASSPSCPHCHTSR